MINELELEYLKNLARAATPGPWAETDTTDWDGTAQTGVNTPTGPLTWDDHEGYVFSPENAAFVATFNPEFVLRLLRILDTNPSTR